MYGSTTLTSELLMESSEINILIWIKEHDTIPYDDLHEKTEIYAKITYLD